MAKYSYSEQAKIHFVKFLTQSTWYWYTNFNFGNNFINWMNILYTKPMFQIKNNGWISKTCQMTRGIRQGCPISAILFLFVAIMS